VAKEIAGREICRIPLKLSHPQPCPHPERPPREVRFLCFVSFSWECTVIFI
jgi:hypothetical protein